MNPEWLTQLAAKHAGTEGTESQLLREIARLNDENKALQGKLDKAKRVLEPFARIFDAWLTRDIIDINFMYWVSEYLKHEGFTYTGFIRQWFEETHRIVNEDRL